MKRILLIGKNGQVSTYLQRALKGDYKLIVVGREQLDLSQPQTVENALSELTPDLIINPAAFTAVDLAEEEAVAAFTINRDSVTEIALYAKQTNTPLIHYSTDYVFSGDADAPYLESDETGPTGVYGQSKLEGEQAILDSGAPALILRTAWVYSNHGKNFYKTMLSLSESRDELSVVDDQIGAPTYAGSIAEATAKLVATIRALFRENGITKMTVNGIPSSDYPTPAQRPAYSVLDGKKLQAVFDVSLPHWGTALAQCAAET